MSFPTQMVELPELSTKLSVSLSSGLHECTICSELVQWSHHLWACPCCYGVFHLKCISKWVDLQAKERRKHSCNSSNIENGEAYDKFHCPLCRASHHTNSCTVYRCYCGKKTNPTMDLMLVPGSCGQPCERRHADPNCPHRCSFLCHPGPCPPCACTRLQACYCGKETKPVGCSSMIYGFECDQPCGKLLDCGQHRCEMSCHTGPCPICKLVVEELCYCGATSRTRRCAKESGFSCQKRCKKLRDCGNHECGLLCHAGSCDICLRLPSRRHYCPCEKTLLTELRTSCTDPIPSCGQTCELPLPCGHLCWYTCHDDSPCAPCKEIVKERCACGNKVYSFPCFCTTTPQDQWAEVATIARVPIEQLPSSYPPRCAKVCGKQLSCKKHKCSEVCCIDTEHSCFRICVKKLSCGQHQCGQLCHPKPCPSCSHVSYERLYCYCHRTFVEPPVPCGTKPPRCPYPCIISRPCGHPSNHPCHIDGNCPECVIPTKKFCASHGHPMPYFMPCHLTDISCGKRCQKVLLCCGGMCTLSCHGGPCHHNCSERFPSFLSVVKKGSR